MFWQTSLLGELAPSFDSCFSLTVRRPLDATSWVDHAPGWLTGSDGLLETLECSVPFRQRRGIRMYDRVVDEPRLTAWWRLDAGAELLPILSEMRLVLSERYAESFDSIGFNLYRNGNDSVAWHGDRHRHVVANPVVAIVSLGAPRPFRLRPRGGGTSLSWNLGNGDLFVMGGACQHNWEHTVPKVRVTTGPRMSVTFRSA